MPPDALSALLKEALVTYPSVPTPYEALGAAGLDAGLVADHLAAAVLAAWPTAEPPPVVEVVVEVPPGVEVTVRTAEE